MLYNKLVLLRFINVIIIINSIITIYVYLLRVS